jgi:hypothetical protein
MLLNVRRSPSISVDFRSLFLFADVVYPLFVRTDVTLETVALDALNNVAVLITKASAKRAPAFCLSSFTIGQVYYFAIFFFHMYCHSTQ